MCFICIRWPKSFFIESSKVIVTTLAKFVVSVFYVVIAFMASRSEQSHSMEHTLALGIVSTEQGGSSCNCFLARKYRKLCFSLSEGGMFSFQMPKPRVTAQPCSCFISSVQWNRTEGFLPCGFLNRVQETLCSYNLIFKLNYLHILL